MNVCCSRDIVDSANNDQDYYLLIITNSSETKPLTTIRRSESMVFVDSSIEAAIALSDIIVSIEDKYVFVSEWKCQDDLPQYKKLFAHA